MITLQPAELSEAQFGAVLAGPDAKAVLAGVACLPLPMCGRQDACNPLVRHDRTHVLPGSRPIVMEELAHMATMEPPALVSAALTGRLRRT